MSEYKPAERNGPPVDPTRCREQVARYYGNWPNFCQCARKAVVDGKWCKQHAPETKKAREDARRARWAEEVRLLHEAEEKKRRETVRSASVEELKAALEGKTGKLWAPVGG